MAAIEYASHPVALINRIEAGTLDIEWPEGKRQTLPHRLLREHCRCADCKAEPEKATANSALVSLVELRLVGAYGVQLFFNDGHNRGIYPWSYLISL